MHQVSAESCGCARTLQTSTLCANKMMHALRQEILPPSGVEFAACLNFTPSTLPDTDPLSQAGRTPLNVVVARSNLLRIFEVREEPAPVSAQKEHNKERHVGVRMGTEAVEGEVEMDPLGEGFVNMGAVKVNPGNHFLLHCFRPPQMLSYVYPTSLTVCVSSLRSVQFADTFVLFSVYWREWPHSPTYGQPLLSCP